MTAAATIIDRALKGIRRYEQPDVLSVAMDSSVKTLAYTGLIPGWGPTTVVEIGSELMLVKEVDTNNRVASVVRGWLNTDPVSHVIDSPIYMNIRQHRSDFIPLFNECLDDLFGHDLYAVESQSYTYDPTAIGYNLVADAIKVLRVDAQKDAYSKDWQPIFDWQMLSNMDQVDFSSGKALMVRVAMPLGAKFRVTYSKAFTALTDETEDLTTDAGLPEYADDLVYYYAMSRLLVDEERRRSQMNSAQNHQRAQDTPPFLSLRTGEWYQARYLDKIITARARLRKETVTSKGTGYGS